MSKKVFAEIENLKQDICFLDIYLQERKFSISVFLHIFYLNKKLDTSCESSDETQ